MSNKLIIESVDDGREGFLEIQIKDKLIYSADHYIFFTDLLEALGYEIEFIYVELNKE